MRIFSKKAFQFDHPNGAAEPVVVQSQSFSDVPDWVTKSAMFALASATEDVTVIESKSDAQAAEKEAADKAAKAAEKAAEKARKKAEEEATATAAAEAEAKAKAEAEAANQQ